MKSLFSENNILLNGFLSFWGFQKCAWCGFYHIWNWFNQNYENCVQVNLCEFGNILDFDIWLESHLVGFCIDFWSKFHLGTKSPMSGKRMRYRLSVFDEIQSILKGATKKRFPWDTLYILNTAKDLQTRERQWWCWVRILNLELTLALWYYTIE